MEKIKITDEIRKKLREPFPKEAHGTVASKTYLTSIKAMYVIERLNDVFGIGRWTYESEVIKEQSEQVLIRGQLMILDYDCFIPAQFGSHKITGKGVELADGYKSAITDGITKSASYIEIGIDVFKGNVTTPQTHNNIKNTSEAIQKTLTANEVNNKWNGKIYGKNQVYIDNVKYAVPDEQILKLKSHYKYKPEEKK